MGRLTLSPASAMPGDKVDVASTVCAGAAADSSAFTGAVTLRPAAGASGFHATATVAPNIGPGRHQVFTACDGAQATAFLTVLPAKKKQPTPRPIVLGVVKVTPATAAGGTTVDVRTDVCSTLSADVTSPAFAKPVTLSPAAGHGLFGTGLIDKAIRPGAYEVFAACTGAFATGTVVVSGTDQGRQIRIIPKGGVSAGGGGTIRDPGATAETAGGALLITAGLLLGAAARRRRDDHEHS